MSSSANDCSDSGEADESFTYSTSMMATSEAINTAPTMSYPMPPPVGTMAQASYPYPDPYYRSIFAPYDSQPYPAQPYPPAQPMVHLQLMGIQQAGVPLPSDAVEEPIFVNAKQYHGILRRRQSRAKAESERKALQARKPYLHESRHLHALKRARGCGGRFVNSKKKDNEEKEVTLNLKKENELAFCNRDKEETGSGSPENSS